MFDFSQYPGVPFKVALPGSWMVILSAPKMMDELWRRPDDEFSLNEIIDEVSVLVVLPARRHSRIAA